MKFLALNFSVGGQPVVSNDLDGQICWVVPVVMMVEGVHHGSHGPVFYHTSELSNSAANWDGAPVVINHPTDRNGNYISAQDQQAADSIVGFLQNTRIVDGKLKSEAVLIVDALEKVSKESYNILQAEQALEVSIGVFTEEIDEAGEWRGEVYRAKATNLIPDHLALLPNAQGACSWEDGCGVRVNQKSKIDVNMSKVKTIEEVLAEKQLFIQNHFVLNEMGMMDIMQNLQRALNALDTNERYYWLEDFDTDMVVYRVSCNGNHQYFKRSYTVREDGSVELGPNPILVRRDVSYMEISANMKRTKYKLNMKANAKPCECSVDSLISNEATKFTEDDREWLGTLNEDQLKKLAPNSSAPAPSTNSADPGSEEPITPTVNKDTLKAQMQAIMNESTSPEDFIDNFMPTGIRGQMKSGLAMYQANRKAVIDRIVANSKFTAEQLQNWADADLKSLDDSLVGPGVYVGDFNPMGGNMSTGDQHDMEMMLNLEKAKA